MAAVRAVNTAFRERMQPAARPAVARHRAELGEQLTGCAGLAIAGGHVAVLLNRLQLFDLPALCPGLPILAWSAGAMALCQRVVLFHDFPPEAEGNAEVLGAGLGLLERLVLLPHARHRLDLDDAARVSLMARRFDPAVCVPLDEGQSAVAGAALTAGEGLRSLQRDGAVRVYQSGEVIR